MQIQANIFLQLLGLVLTWQSYDNESGIVSQVTMRSEDVYNIVENEETKIDTNGTLKCMSK